MAGSGKGEVMGSEEEKEEGEMDGCIYDMTDDMI
jgi:hypothetical protein